MHVSSTKRSLMLRCSFRKLLVLWAVHEDSRGTRNCRKDDKMIGLSKTSDSEILQASMTC